MRIKRLDLKAFGPFTDRTIEFDSKKPGLHIIFGRNEAGKSSSLRALKAFLYGFPERTSDNFQHANHQLMVGGCIQNDQGEKLSFTRRKKRKADMLDSAGNPLEPGRLTTFLQGMESAVFESLFGIDHNTLVAGSKDILEQKGEAGQAIFAAGTGISSLKKILDSLENQANELFKHRGSKQQINQALKAYTDLKKTIRQKSLPPGKYKEHKNRLKDLQTEYERLEEKKRQKTIEIRRLERLSKAIPELAKLENLQKQQSALGDVVVLPTEFSEQVREIEQTIRENRLQIDSNKDRLKKLQKKQGIICVNQAVLDHARTIEDLHQRLGEYRKGQKDKSKLDGMRSSNRSEAGKLIKVIRPDWTLADTDSLIPVIGKKRTIQNLSSRHETITQQASQALRLKNAAKKELDKTKELLSGENSVRKNDRLEKAVKLAQNAGDIDEQIQKISREINSGEKICRAELKRLGLWSGSLDQLLALPLPLPETLRRFEIKFNELDKEKQALKKERKIVETKLKAARTSSKEEAYNGEVPSELDLIKSRKKRQVSWQILRRLWVDGEDVSKDIQIYSPDQPIHDVYEQNVAQADHIADRLRREAQRVARAAALRAEIENLDETILEIHQQDEKISIRRKILSDQWQILWQTLKTKPLSPEEMTAWLTNIDKLRFKLKDIFSRKSELTAKTTARQEYRTELIEELKKLGGKKTFPGHALAPVKFFAESILDDINRHRTNTEKLFDRQERARTELTLAEKKLKKAENAIITWQDNWDKALIGLGLKGQILPGEALDLLEIIGDCINRLEKAKEFQSRINGINRDVKQFNKDVLALIDQAAPDLKALSPDQAVLRMHTLLGKARQDEKLLKKNKEEIEGLTAEIENSKKILHSLDEQMEHLLDVSGTDTPEDLPAAIRKSDEYQRLNEKISDTKSSLAKVCEGISLDQIRSEAGNIIVDELPGQIESLERQIEKDLYPAITDSLKRMGEQRKELQLMDGSGRAAEAAERMEQTGAKIRRLVDQYTKIKLASTLLREEIERFRKEHQGPVLKIASQYFSDLTLGSFSGLRTDMDDKGAIILVGVRPDDSRVTVEGMSDGTCDQLYLSLRLATLKARLEHRDPMPFIVDDILINFDDQRSCATLKVLARIAQKNQVILFTHHRQVVEAAGQIKEPGIVHIHELSRESTL